jgi:hypothetical protein
MDTDNKLDNPQFRYKFVHPNDCAHRIYRLSPSEIYINYHIRVEHFNIHTVCTRAYVYVYAHSTAQYQKYRQRYRKHTPFRTCVR